MDRNEMLPESKGSTAIIIGIIAAIVGAGLGFGVAKMIENNNNTKPAVAVVAPTTDTKAADLRVLLNGLEREHVDLASAATRAGFDGAPTFAATAAQLDTNSHAIADAVGSVYGKDAGDQFYKIWASHIGFFVDYTVAAKKGDKAGMTQAVTNLGGYVEAISDFFSKANPDNLPKQAVADLVTAHVGLLKAAVDSYGAKDFATSYAKEHEANVQIGTIADTLSGAIVKQYPAKF